MCSDEFIDFVLDDNNLINKDSPEYIKEEEGLNDKEKENQQQEETDNNRNKNINQHNDQEDEDYLEKLNEEKNAKYAEYPDKMIEIINKIRENPSGYADFIEDSIKYIIEIPDKEDESKTKLIFKKKVKVALNRGEIAFHEAAEKLRNIEPLPPLEFNGNICIPLPQNEEELREYTKKKSDEKKDENTKDKEIKYLEENAKKKQKKIKMR